MRPLWPHARSLAGHDHAVYVDLLGHPSSVADTADLIRRLIRDRHVVGRTVGQRARQHELAVRRDRQLLAATLQLQARAVQPGDRAADADAEAGAFDQHVGDIGLEHYAAVVPYPAELQRANRRIWHRDAV